MSSLRPRLQLLGDGLRDQSVAEARTLLWEIGVEVHNSGLISVLADHGAAVDGLQVRIPATLIDRALATVPHSFPLHDVLGNRTHDFGGDNVYFTPGSAAINILD